MGVSKPKELNFAFAGTLTLRFHGKTLTFPDFRLGQRLHGQLRVELGRKALGVSCAVCTEFEMASELVPHSLVSEQLKLGSSAKQRHCYGMMRPSWLYSIERARASRAARCRVADRAGPSQSE